MTTSLVQQESTVSVPPNKLSNIHSNTTDSLAKTIHGDSLRLLTVYLQTHGT